MRRQSKWSFTKFVKMQGLNECWPWTGAKTKDGYAQFAAEGRQWKGHRLAYEERHGEIPPWPERVVMHLCNNPSCCNPHHLYLGTASENMEHAGSLGNLSRKGAANGNSKLTLEQVTAIRLDKRPSRAVAKDYGIEKTQVLRIRRGDHWNGST